MADEVASNPRPRKKRAKPKTVNDDEALLAHTPTSNTQLRVDQILQQVVAQSTKEATDVKKKKKKKPKNEEEEHVLESLRKGEGIHGLHKDEDSAILANTYDPDDYSKSEKSNKQRQRRKDKNKDKVNEDEKQNVDENTPEQSTQKKKKKVKKKEEFIEDEIEKELELIDQDNSKPKKEPTAAPRRKKVKSPPPEEESESAQNTVLSDEGDSQIKPKVKKKKKPKTEPPDELSVEEKEEKEEATVEPKTKPRKKKKKKEEDDEEVEGKEEADAEEEDKEPETKEEEEEEKAGKKKKKKKKLKDADKSAEEEVSADIEDAGKDAEDLGEVMGLMIHRTDKLKSDFRILHPVIRVHVVNEETGNYVAKQHQDRAVTSFFETSNEAVKTVLPMMTQPFDFKERKSTIPVWEDLLVFNENFNYFVQARPKVLLLFELIDFVSMNTASRQFGSQKEEGGWHKIAWAFLKVVGKNDKVNVGNKLRLQLFVPPSRYNRVPGQTEVYQWWRTASRTPYPSTLYVTLKSIEPPEEVSAAMRSMFATQKELGHMSYKDLKSMNWTGREKGPQTSRTLTTWTRLFGQLCRVPNTLSRTLTAGKKGCFVVRFSNDGRNLACACQDGTDYPILVYEIPSGSLKGQFQGHFGIIYDLSWSRSDTQLMSASSDGTVRIWELDKLGETQLRLLPHPGFVYTAEFHPRVESVVVTGGYDEVIRVWDISVDQEHGMLQQEMEEHHGHINSVCFDTDDGQKMYSADSVGTILIWNVFVTEQAARKHFVRDWTRYQEIKDPELKDTPINFIKMHPSGRRLLVHARNNSIFMFDLRVQRVMQKYFGAENLKEKICSTITPCGSFVFSGSEDGKLYAWNTDTGDQVAVYTQLNYQKPVTDVCYHPRDHMLAVCSLGSNHPVYLYKYDPLIAQADAASPRPMSPVETTDIEDLETARASALKELDLQTARSKVMSKEEFETQEKARYHRVMKKLETATLQMSQVPGMVVPESLLSSRMDSIGRSGVQSSWKMQFDTDYSLTPRSAAVPPGVLSPHAPAGSGTQLSQQITSHRGYMRAADSDWRPGFSEMGRHGQRSHSPSVYGRPPHLSLNASLNKPQFSFESPVGKTVKHKHVVALYDYRAQRSDDLTLYKGDVIKLLYKDNENWWMGELSDGQQGFFPANYVTEDDDPSVAQRSSRAASVSSSGTLTAVKTKTGELKFLSGAEDSDGETTGNKKKKAVDVRSAGDGRGPSGVQELNDSIEKLLDEYESMA
ncbi:jouberin isoform X2 [Aplysia californica]|uniref:Jouberin isoform X2 n=1 Tax=Aplysia californica TaxID=6500 RepID=A0ABM1VVD0_APLCA|nr:jouberin isoform X2 [Aplysia californica]